MHVGRVRTRGTVMLLAGVVAAAGAATLVRARPSPHRLRQMSPARLVASVLETVARAPSISGRVHATVDLGLPQTTGVGALAGLALVAGDHELRLWKSSAGTRLADLLPAAERTFIANDTDAWAWDSESFTAWRLASARRARAASWLSAATGLVDPVALARRSFRLMPSGTRVSVDDRAVTVAGRDAYLLSLEPHDPDTLVGRVDIAIDALARVPLGVWIYARGASDAALAAEFGSVSFEPVDPSLFVFSPPAGAEVNEPGAHSRPDERDGARSAGRLRLFGRGWATVVAVPVEGVGRGESDPRSLRELLPYSGPLFSVDLVDRRDRSWVLFGAVPPSGLGAAAARLP